MVLVKSSAAGEVAGSRVSRQTPTPVLSGLEESTVAYDED